MCEEDLLTRKQIKFKLVLFPFLTNTLFKPRSTNVVGCLVRVLCLAATLLKVTIYAKSVNIDEEHCPRGCLGSR